MKWRRRLLIAAGVVLLLIAVAWFNAWSILGAMQESRDEGATLRFTPLRGSVVLIEATLEGSRPYSYVASVASLGTEGALLVDSMVSAALAKKITAALDERSVKLRYLINTHAHPDHTRGNVGFGAGPTIIAHRAAAAEMAASLKPFPILPATPPLPAAARPTTTFDDEHTLRINGETITLRHFGPAHTAGDAFVFFEQAHVVHVGDAFLGGGGRAVAAPISGGSFPGLVSALDRLLDLAAPDAIIVGGHGKLGETWSIQDVAQYRSILSAAMDQVAQARTDGIPKEDFLSSATLPEWQGWGEATGATALLEAIWNAEGD